MRKAKEGDKPVKIKETLFFVNISGDYTKYNRAEMDEALENGDFDTDDEVEVLECEVFQEYTIEQSKTVLKPKD